MIQSNGGNLDPIASQTVNRELSFSAVVLALGLAVGATVGAVEGARAIDRHLQVQSCITERTATGWTTEGCYDRRATF